LKYLIKLCFALALFPILTAGANAADNTEASALDALAAYKLPQLDCPDDASCKEGQAAECGGTVYRHTYDDWASGEYMGGGISDECVSGSCAGDGHSKCTVTFKAVELERIYAAASQLDAVRLQRFIKTNEGKVWYNPERRALQVQGCNGLGANIPLSDEVADELYAAS